MPELDGIRGIACILVILDHVFFFSLQGVPGVARLTPWLIGGVDLFFVLSGFLIGGVLLDQKGASNYFKVFWIRRAARIWPVYYLLVLSFLLLVAARPYLPLPWLDTYLLRDPMPLWTYPLFVQNFAQASDPWFGGARWVASTWSLAIEEQFYLLMPPLIYLLSRRSIVIAAVACISGALLFRIFTLHLTGDWMPGYFLLPGRMDSLAFGMLGALAVRSAWTLDWIRCRRRILDVASVATITLMVASNHEHHNLDFSLRSALFAYAILRVFTVSETSWYRRLLSRPLLVFSGGISYALYMYHPAVNGLLHGLVFGEEPKLTDLTHWLVAFTVIAVSVPLAWLSTRYFEMPIRRWSHLATYYTRLTERVGH